MTPVWMVVGASSFAEPVADYVEPLAEGVALDWTTLVLTVVRSAEAGGTRSKREAVEQLAREKVARAFTEVCGDVRVHADVRVEDLLAWPELAEPLTSRLDRWVVTEARYYTSGRVELVAELSLQELLKPWTIAAATEPPAGRQPLYTGLVIDARGSGAQPAFAPRVLASDRTVLFSGSLWPTEAAEHSPVVYVPDPAHPAATRAGDNPMFLRAKTSDGTDLVLDYEETLRYRTALSGARLVGEGRVTVVLDAPS